jgi:hypothetical protein
MADIAGLPVFDTMIGFPKQDSGQYDFIRKQTKDRESREEFEFPVEYMFKKGCRRTCRPATPSG